jgi:hypothetical protein
MRGGSIGNDSREAAASQRSVESCSAFLCTAFVHLVLLQPPFLSRSCQATAVDETLNQKEQHLTD